ncbi:unnamed protein product [Trichogramma brassicae]|uniref:Integrase catalytic domain-containing protein n=1 Tax=Trichogramma brassicae TaxID=86971 RepID=A0A6H5J3R9_9HYME|nr:unnamed protein product [Trichogramma brassicae]
MILLPQESVERLDSSSSTVADAAASATGIFFKKKKSVQTPGTPLERLDAEMNEILLAPGTDEREKWTRYSAVLQRYLQLKERSRDGKILYNKKKTNSNDDDGGGGGGDDTDEALDETEVDIDAAYRKDAAASKSRERKKNHRRDHRRERPCQVSTQGRKISSSGLEKTAPSSGMKNDTVSVDGSPIEGNIVDFVNDTMRARVGTPPHGVSRFIAALRKASVPREFIAHPAVYAGAARLKQAVRKQHKNDEVSAWLEQQDAYNLHTPVIRKFPRRCYNVRNIDDVWEADLMDMRSLKTYNNDYAYLLVVIDALSKYAWIEPLKDKSAQTVSTAFERILRRSKGRVPVLVQTDKGKEFVSRENGSATREKKYTASRRARSRHQGSHCGEIHTYNQRTYLALLHTSSHAPFFGRVAKNIRSL